MDFFALTNERGSVFNRNSSLQSVICISLFKLMISTRWILETETTHIQEEVISQRQVCLGQAPQLSDPLSDAVQTNSSETMILTMAGMILLLTILSLMDSGLSPR